ncbi:MAG TPA: sodium ion-translocating decarboxylase subunit beta [Cellvibrionaceae bacterium]
MQNFMRLWHDSGLYHLDLGQAVMMLVGIGLLFLAIRKGFEPLLLVPIGFGCILANVPGAGLSMSAVENALASGYSDVIAAMANVLGQEVDAGVKALVNAYKEAPAGVQADAYRLATDMSYNNGVLYSFYQVAIATGIAPLVIFMGVGAMTDFGPLLANPKTLFLGAAAQFGIFATVIGAVGLSAMGVFEFTLAEAAAIGIIGGADGPTAIYVSSILAPELLGAIAVAAYSYMALVPMIQPPIMRLLTTQKEREIRMEQLRVVSKREKIVFPLVLLILVAAVLPTAAPLLGMFCFGNLMRECGVVARLSDTAQNALINITTIFLGLAVGSKLLENIFKQNLLLSLC